MEIIIEQKWCKKLNDVWTNKQLVTLSKQLISC